MKPQCAGATLNIMNYNQSCQYQHCSEGKDELLFCSLLAHSRCFLTWLWHKYCYDNCWPLSNGSRLLLASGRSIYDAEASMKYLSDKWVDKHIKNHNNISDVLWLCFIKKSSYFTFATTWECKLPNGKYNGYTPPIYLVHLIKFHNQCIPRPVRLLIDLLSIYSILLCVSFDFKGVEVFIHSPDLDTWDA